MQRRQGYLNSDVVGGKREEKVTRGAMSLVNREERVVGTFSSGIQRGI